jgi:hypothetical protein
MVPALSTAQWIVIAVVAAVGLALVLLFLKLGSKALLILALVAFAAALTTFLTLAYRKVW